MNKITLMKKLVRLEIECDMEEFYKLEEEFMKKVKGVNYENWGIMDSDESPYIFYARAFLAGHRLGKKDSQTPRGR